MKHVTFRLLKVKQLTADVDTAERFEHGTIGAGRAIASDVCDQLKCVGGAEMQMCLRLVADVHKLVSTFVTS
jgi:hypothetical protein